MTPQFRCEHVVASQAAKDEALMLTFDCGLIVTFSKDCKGEVYKAIIDDVMDRCASGEVDDDDEEIENIVLVTDREPS